MSSLNRLIYIYGLIDPLTKHIRYIGKSMCPFSRLESHIRNKEGSASKRAWIASLRSQGLLPDLVILSTCSPANARLEEMRHIEERRASGLLFNLEGVTNAHNLKKGKKRRLMTSQIKRYFDNVE